ncbi:MAG: 6-bladed beta-propeller [Acidobacteriaceae bacterium]|nr:6-bladed beta-propeller [Acidobacteriaceae bacterium]
MSNSRRRWFQQMHSLLVQPPLGHATHRYRLDTQWSQADPTRYPVNDCHEMVQVPDGRLFLLTNHPQNNILIYNTAGKLLDAWTLNLKGAHGLTYHANHLYLTDTGTGQVLQTTLEGKVVLALPHPAKAGAYTERDIYSPTETAVAPNGDIYVADGYGSQYLLHYDKSGQYKNKFGGRSSQPINKGKFLQAHGIALDTRGPQPLLVATARIRNEFHWFTLAGEYVRTVYLPGAYLSRPVLSGKYLYSAVCFGMFPDDYRMWQNRGFVVILDENDKVISAPGAEPPAYKDGRLQLLLQSSPAAFRNPHDVCVDREQNLYVCQWNSGKVYPYKLHREA